MGDPECGQSRRVGRGFPRRGNRRPARGSDRRKRSTRWYWLRDTSLAHYALALSNTQPQAKRPRDCLFANSAAFLLWSSATRPFDLFSPPHLEPLKADKYGCPSAVLLIVAHRCWQAHGSQTRVAGQFAQKSSLKRADNPDGLLLMFPAFYA